MTHRPGPPGTTTTSARARTSTSTPSPPSASRPTSPPFPDEKVAVRMIHGSGQVDLAGDLVIHPRLSQPPEGPSRRGRPSSATPPWWPPASPAVGYPATTRCCASSTTAASQISPRPGNHPHRGGGLAVEPLLEGAGSASATPPPLFHLLEMIIDGAPRPAAIVGCPVGFHRRSGVQAGVDRSSRQTRHRHPAPHGPGPTGRIGHDLLGAQRLGTGAGMSGRFYGVGRPATLSSSHSRPRGSSRCRRGGLPCRRGPPVERPPHRRRTLPAGCGGGAADLPADDREDGPPRRLLARHGRLYVTSAARISGHLRAGRDVVLLAEGDPLLYGPACTCLTGWPWTSTPKLFPACRRSPPPPPRSAAPWCARPTR